MSTLIERARERMERAQDGSFPRDLAGWATEAAGLAASVGELLDELAALEAIVRARTQP